MRHARKGNVHDKRPGARYTNSIQKIIGTEREKTFFSTAVYSCTGSNSLRLALAQLFAPRAWGPAALCIGWIFSIPNAHAGGESGYANRPTMSLELQHLAAVTTSKEMEMEMNKRNPRWRGKRVFTAKFDDRDYPFRQHPR